MKQWFRERRWIVAILAAMILFESGAGIGRISIHMQERAIAEKQSSEVMHVELSTTEEAGMETLVTEDTVAALPVSEDVEMEILVTEDTTAEPPGTEDTGTELPDAVAADGTTVQPQIELYAQAAALLDADTGRVLYEKNGKEQRSMASTTKIMTCILALELGNLQDVVTFSSNAAAQPDVQMNGCEGEQYYLGDLLYSLMLESHNDTAVAIAEHIGGSVEGFAALMNEKAQELGAYETHFVTPNGLDAQGHYTTACDLGRIASYAIQNPDFLSIIQTPSYSFQEINGARTVSVTNRDAFLTSYDGAIGIKTGFTGEAGYCFVGAARRENKTLISVVLASGWPPHKTYKWEDTRSLMNYGMEQYQEKMIISPDYELPTIPVLNGIEADTVPLYLTDSISLLMREDEQVRYIERLPEELEAPVQQGMLVGTVEVYIGEELYQTVVVYTGADVERISYRYIFQRLFCYYFRIQESN